MILTTLADCKAHTRLDLTEETDATLSVYAESAEEMVLQMLDRTVESITEEYGKVPVNIKHAVWMLFAHAYTHREPVSQINYYAVPYTIDALLKPYMTL